MQVGYVVLRRVRESISLKRPKIFIADDHTLFLEAFRNLLEPRYEVIDTAVDGREMLAKVRKLQPDVVLLPCVSTCSHTRVVWDNIDFRALHRG